MILKLFRRQHGQDVVLLGYKPGIYKPRMTLTILTWILWCICCCHYPQPSELCPQMAPTPLIIKISVLCYNILFVYLPYLTMRSQGKDDLSFKFAS